MINTPERGSKGDELTPFGHLQLNKVLRARSACTAQTTSSSRALGGLLQHRESERSAPSRREPGRQGPERPTPPAGRPLPLWSASPS